MLKELDLAFQAVEERRLDLLQTVVPQVIDPNQTVAMWDKNGIKIPKASIMHVACFSGSYDCVKYLIRCGANVSILDDESVSFPLTGLPSTLLLSLATARFAHSFSTQVPTRMSATRQVFVSFSLDRSSSRRFMEPLGRHSRTPRQEREPERYRPR